MSLPIERAAAAIRNDGRGVLNVSNGEALKKKALTVSGSCDSL